MSFPFRIIEHTIPGQHIREYPQSTRGNQETPHHLAIKQYIPIDTPIPDNAITIIGFHGNGNPKETYEPLWEDLYTELKQKGLSLRGIWVADISNQGASGILNENIQGDRTNWYDHSRDILHMVNHFRDEISRPIIGVGHSMGCAQLVNLSIMHPRLLSTLIMFDPTIFDISTDISLVGPNPGLQSSLRRDLWSSAEKAKTALSKSLRKWDPRVQERYLKFGLRNVPTAIYKLSDPNVGPEAVTLTTTKHQETWSYYSTNLEHESLDRFVLPDWDSDKERPYIVARPECQAAFRNLPFLRPSVLYAFGGKSPLSSPQSQDAKMRATGTGAGGSGGVQAGMVEKVVLKEGTHSIVCEDVGWCAEVGAGWIQKWFNGWLEDEKFWSVYQSRHSDDEMLRLSKEASISATVPIRTKRGDLPKGKL
ncbi:hypothetical protein N7520_008349 [Penicillium odoratum]|uniref:uncharacterized protein n=1 Tax=Penicillium odoratum TaxID=1167516 RepID=UPI00254903EB|nr:uncharacterized protein N7520_008349 [Penicillium odoratum]KAJ5761193.1 hypothetical protein N7520_008349 [Penicillium odoratum]